MDRETRYLTFALTKGRLAKKTMELFEKDCRDYAKNCTLVVEL